MENTPRHKKLTHVLLQRLMHYYHFLSQFPGDGVTVTSRQIADLVHIDDTLVRKDLAAIGVRGYPRMGFRAVEVVTAIRRLLGFDRTCQAVVIGAGRLGGALAAYSGFDHYGIEVLGLFDDDPEKLGWSLGGLIIQPMAELAEVVSRYKIRLAILTVPPEDAQTAANLAVAAGIQAIWNFATTNLVAPPEVFVRHEHISVGLAQLSYFLRRAPAAAIPHAADDPWRRGKRAKKETRAPRKTAKR